MQNLLPVLIILGIVQGIAEFLPVSSSGHLVILEQFDFIKTQLSQFGEGTNLFINVALHIATLIGVVIYMWKDITNLVINFFAGIFKKDFKRPEIKIVMNILIASVPAGIIGFLLNDFFNSLFSSALAAYILLIINGIVLISTKKIPVKDRNIEHTGSVRSLIVGFFQAFAILPGISRSGMTIAGGMMNGLAPLEAARFSFLMAIPVIAGAGLHEGMKAATGAFPDQLLMPLAFVMLITIVVSLFSLKLLFALVKRIKLDIFGYYTIAAGLFGIIHTLLS